MRGGTIVTLTHFGVVDSCAAIRTLKMPMTPATVTLLTLPTYGLGTCHSERSGLHTTHQLTTRYSHWSPALLRLRQTVR